MICGEGKTIGTDCRSGVAEAGMVDGLITKGCGGYSVVTELALYLH